jgi:hypothetical protein
MYLSILAAGLVDLCTLRYPDLPPGLGGLVLVCGFASQGFILVFHLTGPELDIRLHTLLVVASFGAAAAIAAALLRAHSQCAAFVRCVVMLTLGSFYIQAGDLMFRRPAFDSHEGASIAPALFVLHAAGWGACIVCFLLVSLQSVAGGGTGRSSPTHALGDADARELPAAVEEGGALLCTALPAGKARQSPAAKLQD